MITLVERIVVGANTQNQDFAATIAGDTDRGYTIRAYLENGTASGANVNVRLNGATAVLTQRQFLSANNTTISGGRAASNVISAIPGSSTVTLEVEIPKSDTGDARHLWVTEARDVGASISDNHWAAAITTPAVGTEITSAGIGTDVANSIGAGSILELWKWS